MLYNEESILMKKYGYNIQDECFGQNDDWRNLFDMYLGSKDHNELVLKYIAPAKHQNFIKDLYYFEKQKELINQKILELANALGSEVTTFDNVYDCVVINILGE